MTNLIVPDREAHWYTALGEPMYMVPRADGQGMRATTVTDAKKYDLRPSVTGILGVIEKPALASWKATQYVLSALTLPKLPQESQDDFARRVVKDAMVESYNAADFGTTIHALAEGYLENTLPETVSIVERMFLDGFMEWATIHQVEAMGTEISFATEDYGGRCDFLGLVSPASIVSKTTGDRVWVKCSCGCNEWNQFNFEPRLVVADWKTEKTVPDKPFRFYNDWGPQLAGYRRGLDEPHASLMSVAISSTEPGRVGSKIWEGDWPERVFDAAKSIYYSPLGQGWGLVKDNPDFA